MIEDGEEVRITLNHKVKRLGCRKLYKDKINNDSKKSEWKEDSEKMKIVEKDRHHGGTVLATNPEDLNLSYGTDMDKGENGILHGVV